MLANLSKLNTVGETIVEVLIVTMILGTVLTGAFVITTKATNADQAAQERSEASAYAQEQLERLKSLLSNKTVASPSGNFCMNPSDNQPLLVSDTSIGGCKETIHNRYAGYINFDSTTQTFNETIVWAAPGGGYDKVKMQYKVNNE